LTLAKEFRGSKPLDEIGKTAGNVSEQGKKTIDKTADAAQDAVDETEKKGRAAVDRTTNRTQETATNTIDNTSDTLKKAFGGWPLPNQTDKAIDNATNSIKGGVGSTLNASKDVADTALDKGANASSEAVNVSRDAVIIAWNASTSPFAVLGNDAKTTEAGNSKALINFVIVGIMAFLAVSIGLGYIIDKGAFPSLMMPKKRPSAMTVSLLTASYALLVPGLTGFIFSFNIVINEGDWLRLAVTKDNEGNPGPCTESAVSLLHRLLSSGNALGAFFLFLYAVLVPLFKVTALIFGECWRCSEDEALVNRSRLCILSVHFISKWASPDMFAYVLFNHLLRSLHQPPTLESVGHLDVGFDYFSIFCLLSTFASLGIRPPPPPKKPAEPAAPILATGTRGLRTAISGLTCMWSICMLVGVSISCLRMRLDERAFDQMEPTTKASAMLIIEDLNLTERMSADVSIVGCLMSLVRWLLFAGEANLVLAFVLLAGFVVVLPIWHMMVLLKAAYQIDGVEAATTGQLDPRPDSSSAAVDSATVLNHIAMLDVCIMGVAVVVLCSGAYKEQGLIMSLGYGFFSCLAAEVFRYTAHYMVMNAARKSMGDLPAGILLRQRTISNLS